MEPDRESREPARPTPRSDGRVASWHPLSGAELAVVLPQFGDIELIGRGGMGAVYKARQLSVDRIVAVKVLPRVSTSDDLKFAERFKQEARAMARLSHPGIVAVHDAGETADGLLYLVMEFVDGTDVARRIEERGRIGSEEARRIAMRVCEALAFAHEHGIVHRDIKPANVMLDSAGQVKVADFGLAKMEAGGSTTMLTQSNVMMGSPDFIAPEGLKRGGALDHRADIFAVGVMLYQMLTGELPRGLFKVPSRLVPGLDERFDAIVCKAMEPDPSDRQQSSRELLAELEALNAPPSSPKPRVGARMLVYAAAALFIIAAGFALMRSDDKPAETKAAAEDEVPWQPIFNSPEDFIGKRAEFKDGWAVLTDRPLTLPHDVRDGAIRATTRYRRTGGSIAVRANRNGHLPVTAFISGEGTLIVLNFWPDYGSKESQRQQFKLPKPLTEGEEFTMELSARGDDFDVSVNGMEVGRAHRELPNVFAGTMGVIPAVNATVEFKDIAWREFPSTAP